MLADLAELAGLVGFAPQNIILPGAAPRQPSGSLNHEKFRKRLYENAPKVLLFNLWCTRNIMSRSYSSKVLDLVQVQCCGSILFWSGSGSADPCHEIVDPDLDPTPTPDPNFNRRNFFSYFFFNQNYNTQNYVFFLLTAYYSYIINRKI